MPLVDVLIEQVKNPSFLFFDGSNLMAEIPLGTFVAITHVCK